MPKFKLIEGSLHIKNGRPYQDAVRLEAIVDANEEKHRTITIAAVRNGGHSWKMTPLEVSLILGYEEKRRSPVTRVADVSGLREAVVTLVEEFWGTFKPYPEQVEALKRGDYDVLVYSKLLEGNHDGRTVAIVIDRIPFGSFVISTNREFNVEFDKDPALEGLTSVFPLVNAYQKPVFSNPDASGDNYGSERTVSGTNTLPILEYLAPALVRAAQRKAKALATQRTKLSQRKQDAASFRSKLAAK